MTDTMFARIGREEDFILGDDGQPWEIVVGVETHAQIRAASKLFSRAETDFAGEPNARANFVDAAFPGVLPTLNGRCIEIGAMAGLALGGRINLRTRFDRKHYFYPDLPQGYQITQHYAPLVEGGALRLEMGKDRYPITARIERLHIEQDAGKSLHQHSPAQTLIDLNRAGSGLMEIVSMPDLRSPEEVQAYVRELRLVLRHIGACSGDMDKGELRADINVSLRRPGGEAGTRREIKNVNSLRFIGRAVAYEAQTQAAILDAGETVRQQTMLFDEATQTTRPMRDKESAHDYRYFPDPDLPPLELSEEWLAKVRDAMPVSIDEVRAAWIAKGLRRDEAWALAEDPMRAQIVGDAMAEGAEPRLAANWTLIELAGVAARRSLALDAVGVDGARLAELIALIVGGDLSALAAKDALAAMVDKNINAARAMETLGLRQLSAGEELDGIAADVIKANPRQAAQVVDKPQTLGWLIGQMMKATGGRANPKAAREALLRALKTRNADD